MVGLKRGTRLAGVGSLKRDSIWAYFNPDNRAKLDNCLRLACGRYTLYATERDCNVVFQVVLPVESLR